jgi:hypothetical protein
MFNVIPQTGELAKQSFLCSLWLLFLKEGLPFLLIGSLLTQEMINNDEDPLGDGYRRSLCSSSFLLARRRYCGAEITLLLVRGPMSSLNEEAS